MSANEIREDLLEGDPCPVPGCDGILELPLPENCTCHISPPCASCMDREPVCPVCRWRIGDPIEIETSQQAFAVYTEREIAIAKVAYRQGYEHGHEDTVEGQYTPPEEYDYDALMEQMTDGTFDDVPPACAPCQRAMPMKPPSK